MPTENEDFVQDNQEVVDNPIDNQNDDFSGEDDLIKAIRELANQKDDEDDSSLDSDDDTDDTDDTDDSDDSDSDDTPEDDSADTDKADQNDKPQDKKQQTPEENAKFAAQRRQAELDAKVQAELARLKQESPEFLLAKQLSEMYGVAPDVLMQQIQEANLQKEAQERKIPVEELREKQELKNNQARLEQEINQLRFEGWKSKIEVEKTQLQSQFKMLTTEDMDKAVDYMLTVVRNVDMPLEEAVYAVHGKKIVESLAKEKIQDELANQSGRKKKTPPAPNGGKPKDVVSLTDEEHSIARAFGMTDAEYQKYKS